jgi:hydrocephalus-inducing protein
VIFKSGKTVKFDKIDLLCETQLVEQKPDPETGAKYKDWDDTMKTVRMVRPSEYKKIMRQREEEERRRKEEAEAAAAAAAAKGKAPAKAPAKPAGKDEAKADEIVVDMSEEPSVELVDTIPEPEHVKVEGSDKTIPLKTTLVCDQIKYDCTAKTIDFKPTLMYASRSYKFAIKNTSLITMNYNFKIVNSETGVLDAGPYTVIPKKGSIAPGCDDTFIVKFSPTEVEHDFSRILSANIENLSPEVKPLILEVNGVAERPIVHFELPPSTYKERKEKDMVAIDNKFKIIEFDSMGTNIKNTKRFMAVNPTSQGYEFEWEEVPDEHKKLKPMFKCTTTKGLILSGKKFEMIFEYTPDNVGEHESFWLFKVPSEKIVQHFMVVGRVAEPNVLFETGKIKFGPLLLEGKNRETVNIINQEQIPFSFNFSKESVKGSPEFGDSLRVNPMSGVVAPQSQLPIEILFFPKYELTYNYNLICNVKRKARPLVLNVKGEGYKIHHSVFADVSRVPVTSTDAYKFEYGDFFINEKKTKSVTLTNNGEFNFDFVWKRQVNKYITITPETGTVPKGSETTFEITYLPIAEHQLKNYKVSLNIVSGPKYDFMLNGNARKPGVKLSFQNYDFGPSFVMRQPMSRKAILEIVNYDNSAISVEIPNFEKKPYLDV